MTSFSSNPRQICLWIHRYTGLAMAAFLIIAGITGTLLAFHDELDALFNQRLTYVDKQQTSPMSIASLHDTVISTYPEYNFSTMPVTVEPNRAVVFVVDKYKGDVKVAPEPLFQEVYINPYTAEILGSRNKDEWAWRNTMWKVFWLHRELLLGDIGKLILGVAALIWTINCFIGFYLTLPRTIKKNSKNNKAKQKKNTQNHNKQANKKRSSLFKRWLPAWKIRTKTNAFKLNYDLHHAFGLWLWLIFFVIAWSSVGFNLKQVYQPAMQAAVGLEGKKERTSKLSQSSVQSAADAKPFDDEAYAADMITKVNSIEYVSRQADIAAQKNGLIVTQLLGIRWIEEDDQWQLRFKTNKDIGKKGGVSSITINAENGSIERVNFGYQSASFGSKADQWLSTLHMGHISYGAGHLLYQIFLALVGLAVAVLSGTGVYLWYKGRQQRSKVMQKNKRQLLELITITPYQQSPDDLDD